MIDGTSWLTAELVEDGRWKMGDEDDDDVMNGIWGVGWCWFLCKANVSPK
jgi:hypothetical protein